MKCDALHLILSLLTVTSGLAAAQTLAFTGVTVIDVEDGSAKPGMTVIVIGDRITNVGPTDLVSIPAGTRAIDGRGQYLVPGLWDMHVHLFNQVSGRPPNEWYFPLLIANGVTGVREMWTRPSNRPILESWRARATTGTLLTPRIAAVGALVDGPASRWPTSDRVGTADEARRAVREIHEAGLDFVKVYDMLPREAYFAITEEARRLGLPVAGHVPTLIRTEEAIAAGQRTAEHLLQIRESCSTREEEILRERALLHSRAHATVEDDSLWERHERIKTETFDRARCAEVARRLAAGSMWQVPTLVNERRWYLGRAPEYRHDTRLRYVPANERKVWEDGYAAYGIASDDLASMTYLGSPAELAQRWAVAQKVVEVLGTEGVPVLAGTDLGGPYIFPGFSLHDELAFLVKAGLTPLAALRAATLNPARFLGSTDSLGTIAAGKLADLVLLAGNPLVDIRNTRRINAVMLRGRLLDRASLDELQREAERAAHR
jgi:imidazolonepropionase-like amidohydrolase